MTPEAGDGLKALADFWSAQGTALLEAQGKAARSMADGMQAMMSGKLPTVASTDLQQPELVQATEAMAKLWSAASGLSTDLLGRMTQTTGGEPGAFERMVDPRHWMAGVGGMDDALARMADGPRLADLFDLERRNASVMKRWTELRQRSLEHQQVVLQAWVEAGKTFMTELAGRAAAAGRVLESKEAVALWADIGNRTLVDAQRSEAFLRSQRAVIRASTELRLAQTELSEHLGKQFGLPTRTEIDDVHRSLTEMRRELRRTRRELEALTARREPERSGTGKITARQKAG